jgi:integrase
MIKDVHFVRKRLADGRTRWYIYAWRGGPQVMTADGNAKPKLSNRALKAITAERQDRAPEPQPETGPQTLETLIRKWRSLDPSRPSSPEWERLTPSTKKTWGSALNRISEKWGAVPLEVFNDPRMTSKIVDWRDNRAATPRGADIGITVLQTLLKYGVQRGILALNVADGIGKLYVNGQRVEIIWTPADLAAFTAAAGDQNRDVNDAVQFAAVTGLRREDLATVTWQQVKEFAIVKRAKKRSRGVRRFATIPRIRQLDAILERLRDRPRQIGVDTVLVTKKGIPWNLDTLSKEVSRIARAAGIVHIDEETGRRINKHLHDVRGTFATWLMTETDLDDQEIAAIMGWSPADVARIRKIYVDDVARTVALGRRIAGGL